MYSNAISVEGKKDLTKLTMLFNSMNDEQRKYFVTFGEGMTFQKSIEESKRNERGDENASKKKTL